MRIERVQRAANATTSTAGEHLRARYRVIAHDGDAAAADVAGAYAEYLKLTDA